MEHDFHLLQQIISNRRTVKPPQMNGKEIPAKQVVELLKLADWAPTHGHTEPWRFIVYAGGDKVKEFCAAHAHLYRQEMSPDSFQEGKFEKLRHMGDTASHVLVAYMRRGNLPKIPELEEIAATACAIQNLLLGAAALGLAAYWGSGGMAYHPAMNKMLQLRDQDIVLGVLYLGYTDAPVPVGKRVIALEEKVRWV